MTMLPMPARIIVGSTARVSRITAGNIDGFIPTAELEDEVWDRVLAVNLSCSWR